MTTIARSMRQLLLALICLFAVQGLGAATISDENALRGVEEGKAVFLFDMANPDAVALYLELAAGTHKRLSDYDVAPDFVIVFIGPTVQYLAAEPDEDIRFEFPEQLERIRAALTKLDELGVRLEVCAIACDVFGVDQDNLLPELKLISDGFISLIGYQEQGYHLVPLF